MDAGRAGPGDRDAAAGRGDAGPRSGIAGQSVRIAAAADAGARLRRPGTQQERRRRRHPAAARVDADGHRRLHPRGRPRNPYYNIIIIIFVLLGFTLFYWVMPSFTGLDLVFLPA